MQTILSFHKLAQLLFKFIIKLLLFKFIIKLLLFKFIIKLLLPIFLEKKLISSVVTIYLSGYSLHTRKYNVPFFRMAQACEGHVLPSMNLASKRVSKLLINGITMFKD